MTAYPGWQIIHEATTKGPSSMRRVVIFSHRSGSRLRLTSDYRGDVATTVAESWSSIGWVEAHRSVDTQLFRSSTPNEAALVDTLDRLLIEVFRLASQIVVGPQAAPAPASSAFSDMMR
ncbi:MULTISPECIES: hypothetical protein [Mumia]|uniref:hypothetical protein n=1 Tax=Mumia TaxID=1546255 RepID=UPI001421D687|nr:MULTISPECIES: hypothetical protein [unclassified Mumia]QMW66693.1 hypothetical protein H4N58_01605 [Mumia sp. ZJ1417]